MDTFHTFHHLADFPVRPASKESGDRLPLWCSGRRSLYIAPVRRNSETPLAKTNYFCHGSSLSGSGVTLRSGGLGIREQIMGMAVLYP